MSGDRVEGARHGSRHSSAISSRASPALNLPHGVVIFFPIQTYSIIVCYHEKKSTISKHIFCGYTTKKMSNGQSNF
jgi:hypothetical protein